MCQKLRRILKYKIWNIFAIDIQNVIEMKHSKDIGIVTLTILLTVFVKTLKISHFIKKLTDTGLISTNHYNRPTTFLQTIQQRILNFHWLFNPAFRRGGGGHESFIFNMLLQLKKVKEKPISKTLHIQILY